MIIVIGLQKDLIIKTKYNKKTDESVKKSV